MTGLILSIVSNIVALLAGMCMRAIVGPCCDRYGPRRTSKLFVHRSTR